MSLLITCWILTINFDVDKPIENLYYLLKMLKNYLTYDIFGIQKLKMLEFWCLSDKSIEIRGEMLKNPGVKKDFKDAFIATIPVFAGYIVLGMGFGILLQEKGYGVQWAVLMSMSMYSGTMQYLGVELLATGASIITTAITTLMVNARHLFYGISLIEKYKGAKKFKPYMIFGLTDETYSLVVSDSSSDTRQNPHRYFFLVTILDHCYWICGCVLGVVVGSLLPISFEGIDFVLTALFVTIVVEQWKSTNNHIPAIIGAVASVICLLIFGADSFLIPAMVLIIILLATTRRLERGGEN